MQQGNVPIHLACSHGKAGTRTLEKQRFIIHRDTTEPTKNRITWSHTLELHITLCLMEINLTVTSWKASKTSAASSDKEGQRVREFKLKLLNVTRDQHKYMKYYSKQYT